MNKRVIPIRLSSVFILCIFSFFVFLPASALAACPDTMTSYWKLDGELNPPYLNEIDPDFDGVCRPTDECPTATATGAVGEGAQVFVTGKGINIPASATSNAPFDWAAGDSFTIEIWIKREGAIGGTRPEVAVGRSNGISGSLQWWVGLTPSGYAAFSLRDPAGNIETLVDDNEPLNDGEWYHIVGVRDAGQRKNLLYVDGLLAKETIIPFDYTGDFKSDVHPMNIGWLFSSTTPSPYNFNGIIDEVALYDVALPARIIERHYTLMKPYCEVSAPGVFRKGAWYMDANGTGQWDAGDTTGSFGVSTDIPISGDWNGDGFTSIGVFRNGAWYLDTNGSGRWDSGDTAIGTGLFGISTDIPITGDWNGDGRTSIGVFRNGAWYLDTNGSGKWDSGDTAISVGLFGISTDIPVTGDWNGDGITKIGVFRNGAWYLDSNGSGKWDTGDTAIPAGSFGAPTDIPVTGDWNGDGITNVGVFRNGAWYLDYNGNGKWDPGVDIVLPVGSFGISNDKPITGVWRGVSVSR